MEEVEEYLTSNVRITWFQMISHFFFPWIDDISLNLVCLNIYLTTNIKTGKQIVQQCAKEFGNEIDKEVDTEFGHKTGNFRKTHNWIYVWQQFSRLQTLDNSFSN